MPSVKSYQNRKHEIELLRRQVEELEANKKQLEREYTEYAEYTKKHALDCSQLEHDNRVLKTQLSVSKMIANITSEAENQIIDALHNKVTELERKVRIYRDYIRYGEAFYPEHHIVTLDVPACLKPVDVLTWHKLQQEYEFQNSGKISIPNDNTIVEEKYSVGSNKRDNPGPIQR